MNSGEMLKSREPDYISAVDEFAELMKKRLKEKEAKWGNPEDYTAYDMRLGLLDEIREWKESVGTEQEDEELIDIANYAFLIWYLKRKKAEGGEEGP